MSENEKIFENDKSRMQCFYHALLIANRKVWAGYPKSNIKLRGLLESYKDFKGIFYNTFGLFKDDMENDEAAGRIKKDIGRIKFDFEAITINDPGFPEHLRQIGYATPVIYVRGDKRLFSGKSMGVVGTRKLEDENDITDGKVCLERLIKAGYIIVSGLAQGCDTLAHKYAVEHDGRTIAVLGTPLDRSAVKMSMGLQEKIAEEHLLVSQYPIGINTHPSFFKSRNITTVALSKEGICVILAADGSGTMGAVEECYKESKPIYALESNFERGCKWVEKYRTDIKRVMRR